METNAFILWNQARSTLECRWTKTMFPSDHTRHFEISCGVKVTPTFAIKFYIAVQFFTPSRSWNDAVLGWKKIIIYRRIFYLVSITVKASCFEFKFLFLNVIFRILKIRWMKFSFLIRNKIVKYIFCSLIFWDSRF